MKKNRGFFIDIEKEMTAWLLRLVVGQVGEVRKSYSGKEGSRDEN